MTAPHPFLVACRRCGWWSTDDDTDDDPGLTTARDAIAEAEEHRCEPEVMIRCDGRGEWLTVDELKEIAGVE